MLEYNFDLELKKKKKDKNIFFGPYILAMFSIWSPNFNYFILVLVFLNLLSFWSLLSSHLQRTPTSLIDLTASLKLYFLKKHRDRPVFCSEL